MANRIFLGSGIVLVWWLTIKVSMDPRQGLKELMLAAVLLASTPSPSPAFFEARRNFWEWVG
jgi:hypothetical protein